MTRHLLTKFPPKLRKDYTIEQIQRPRRYSKCHLKQAQKIKLSHCTLSTIRTKIFPNHKAKHLKVTSSAMAASIVPFIIFITSTLESWITPLPSFLLQWSAKSCFSLHQLCSKVCPDKTLGLYSKVWHFWPLHLALTFYALI